MQPDDDTVLSARLCGMASRSLVGDVSPNGFAENRMASFLANINSKI